VERTRKGRPKVTVDASVLSKVEFVEDHLSRVRKLFAAATSVAAMITLLPANWSAASVRSLIRMKVGRRRT